MRDAIKGLIASGISANKVSVETGLPRNTVYRIFTGEADLDNITLKNAEVLYQYWKENKLKLVNVFVADNGDVLFEHDSISREYTESEVNEVIAEAKEKYEKGEYTLCEARVSDFAIAYYLEGEFFANADIHVTEKFVKYQNFVYLVRESDETVGGQIFKKGLKIARGM